MAYYMNKSVPAKRGDIFYISNSKCYATDPSNAEGRPAIVGLFHAGYEQRGVYVHSPR